MHVQGWRISAASDHVQRPETECVRCNAALVHIGLAWPQDYQLGIDLRMWVKTLMHW